MTHTHVDINSMCIRQSDVAVREKKEKSHKIEIGILTTNLSQNTNQNKYI